MSLGLVFWILMLVAAVFGAWSNYPLPGGVRSAGWPTLIFVLLVILGWAVFGPPIRA